MGKSNDKTTVTVQDDGSLATILPIKRLLDAANEVRKPNTFIRRQSMERNDNTNPKHPMPVIVVNNEGGVLTTGPIKQLLDAAKALQKLPEEEGRLLAEAVMTALFCIVCDHSKFLETELAFLVNHVRECANPEMVNLLLPPDQLKEALKPSSGFPSKGTPTCQ